MITAEETKRYAEAQKCKGCLDWHKYCKAECCKMVLLNIAPEELEKAKGKYLLVKMNQMMSASEVHYFKLRDVRCTRGTLRFLKERIEVIGRKLYYFYTCDLLSEDYKCKGHPHGKPLLCKALTLETSDDLSKGYFITENCLFKYKEKGGINNGK